MYFSKVISQCKDKTKIETVGTLSRRGSPRSRYGHYHRYPWFTRAMHRLRDMLLQVLAAVGIEDAISVWAICFRRLY